MFVVASWFYWKKLFVVAYPTIYIYRVIQNDCRCFNNCHLVLQMQPHVISFYVVTSRIRFMFLHFPLGVRRMLLRSIRRTPSQLHSLQQIPKQHDMLPQHLVYKNELNREYVITLARNDETPRWWSEKIETCRSGFKWKLYRCICWLIVEVILIFVYCFHFHIFFQISLHLRGVELASLEVCMVIISLTGRGEWQGATNSFVLRIWLL